MIKEDYRCPFCKSHISKERYDKVIKENRLLKEKISQLEVDNKKYFEKHEEDKKKLEGEKKKHELLMQKEKEKIKKAEQQIKKKLEEDKKKHEEAMLKQKEKMKENEASIKSNEKKKYADAVKNLELKIKQLEEGKTASEGGFDFEKELYGVLKVEFPSDEVKHTGKMGDIIIEVKSKGDTIGILLIELKKVARHTTAHIEEVKRHKIDASADVGVLVTNGDFGKTKMDGFKNIDDVLIIRPNSAVDFLKLLRKHLTEIYKLKLSFEEKENERAKLWEFIHSIEFETQMNSIFRDINLFKGLDDKETKILKERNKIEDHLLHAYNIIKDGIKKSKRE